MIPTKKKSVLSKKEKLTVLKQSKTTKLAMINKLKSVSSSKLGSSATDTKKVGKKIRINLRDKIDVEVVNDSDNEDKDDDNEGVDVLDDVDKDDEEVVPKTKSVVKTGRGKKTNTSSKKKDFGTKLISTKLISTKDSDNEDATDNLDEDDQDDQSRDATDNLDEDAKDATDDQDDQSKDATDNLDDKIQMPALEMVSDALKERYEYKPILRSEIVYVRPEDRITSEVMTIFEYCEVVSVRAKQIENGGVVFTDIGDLTDPLEIARLEVANKRCPIDIVRMITDIVAERWHVNEMAIPHHA